jgi:hypothetical protein
MVRMFCRGKHIANHHLLRCEESSSVMGHIRKFFDDKGYDPADWVFSDALQRHLCLSETISVEQLVCKRGHTVRMDARPGARDKIEAHLASLELDA